MTFRFFFLQKRVKLRTDLSELEKIGIKSFNLGILRTRVWTVKEIGLACESFFNYSITYRSR